MSASRRVVLTLLCCAPQIRATAQSTPENLRAFVSAYAHDSMRGRFTGTDAIARGTLALADAASRLGLRGIGERGSLVQDVPLVRVSLNPSLITFEAGGPPGGSVYGVDYLPLPGIGGLPFGRRAAADYVIFGGRLGTPTAISPEMSAGKVVLVQPPVRPDGREDYQIWNATNLLAPYRRSLAVLVIALDVTPASVRQAVARSYFELSAKTNRDPPIPPVVLISEAVARRLLKLSPGQAIGSGGALDSATIGFTFNMNVSIDNPRAPTRNVVAVLEGSDANLKSEYVVLSARLDQADIRERNLGLRRSWPLTADTVMNGADAITGAASLLEVARVLVAQAERPKRSIVFLWTIATDDGMAGSEFFVNSALIPRDSIVANINVDHVGRGRQDDLPIGGPQYLEVTGSRRVSSQFGDWLDDVNRALPNPFNFNRAFDTPGSMPGHFCNGDHWSFARYGIPSVFITTGTHADYRAPGDEVGKIDFAKLARVTDVIRMLAVDVADKPARPVIDGPTPDPVARCTQ